MAVFKWRVVCLPLEMDRIALWKDGDSSEVRSGEESDRLVNNRIYETRGGMEGPCAFGR